LFVRVSKEDGDDYYYCGGNDTHGGSDVVHDVLLDQALDCLFRIAALALATAAFTAPVNALSPGRLWENSVLHLILGGAALQRCDKRRVFNGGFSR
jgi:hypothetical protein